MIASLDLFKNYTCKICKLHMKHFASMQHAENGWISGCTIHLKTAKSLVARITWKGSNSGCLIHMKMANSLVAQFVWKWPYLRLHNSHVNCQINAQITCKWLNNLGFHNSHENGRISGCTFHMKMAKSLVAQFTWNHQISCSTMHTHENVQISACTIHMKMAHSLVAQFVWKWPYLRLHNSHVNCQMNAQIICKWLNNLWLHISHENG